jgi:hypothetical protein
VKELPDKLSELIDVTVADVELCMRDPRYRWVPCSWHEPVDNYCGVCLAGAVMAKSLDAPPDDMMFPNDYTGRDHVKLLALEGLRNGDISAALYIMCKIPYGAPNPLDDLIGKHPGGLDRTPDSLLVWLRKASAKLKEHNL